MIYNLQVNEYVICIYLCADYVIFLFCCIKNCLMPSIFQVIVIIAISCTAIIDDYVYMILLLKGNKLVPKIDFTRYNS